MRDTVDVRVVDWGVSGHEVPFITNVVEAFRSAGLSVAISLPSTCVHDVGYRSLIHRFHDDDAVYFDNFERKVGPRRPRRFHKFFSSFLTNASILTKSRFKSRLGSFFTTINPYFDPKFGSTQTALGCKWAGHILHPQVTDYAISLDCVQSIGLMRLCRGLGLTDERLVSNTNIRFGSRFPSFNFPEFADLSVADVIVSRRRPLCLLIGALSAYKNVVMFLQFAEINPHIDFHLAGPLSSDQYTASELAFIVRSISQNNVKRTDRYLSDGAEFNNLILSCDLVWLNYRTFEHSSNVQIKANAFGIPCIVSNSGLINYRRKSSDVVFEDMDVVKDYISNMSVLETPILERDLQRDVKSNFIDSVTATGFLL